MTTDKQQKIKRFLADQVMCEAVYDVLLAAFLKPRKDADVQMLAAARLSIDLLQEGWKELEKLKDMQDDEKRPFTQVGM